MANITTKYRPKKIDEIVGQEYVKKYVKIWIDKVRQGEPVPNLLFVGEPGVGKTTFAFAIANELFGESWKAGVLELNASDERGIDVMREKVKRFAETCPVFSSVKLNLIILDEADYLTPEAQAVLRRLMEDYGLNTKFILCCNWINRIIEPIRDRCAIYRFDKYTKDQIKIIVERIAKSEELDCNVEDVAEKCNGSVRTAINLLFSNTNKVKIIDKTVDTNNLKDLLFEFDVDEVINKVFEQVKSVKDDKFRVKLAMKLMDAEYHIKFGCNPYLQLYGVLSAWEKMRDL